MAKQAHRLQDHAGNETEIAIALGQKQFDKQHMEKVLGTDDGGNDDDTSRHDPLPAYDVRTPQLCERLIQQSAESQIRARRPSRRKIRTMQFFRPVCHGIAALRTLLDARAIFASILCISFCDVFRRLWRVAGDAKAST